MKLPRYIVPSLLTPGAAFEQFRDAALAHKPVVCRVSIPVVCTNLDTAFRAIAPRVHELATLLPTHDLRPVLDMQNLSRALLHAGGRVTVASSSGETQRKLADCRRHREPMLLIAEGLALLGHVPAERVAKIREGTGGYDNVRDVIDLVGLYREFASTLAGKHPFDEAWLAAAEAVAVEMLAILTPVGAERPGAPTSQEAARIRDGLWAMILQRDTKLRVVAAVLFEDKAAECVPALLSRAATSAVTEVTAPSEGSTPTPTPGASTPPAPMRPQRAKLKKTRAQARRRR